MFLHQLHHHDRESGLRERGGGHHGVRREREILLSVAHAVGFEVDDLAAMQERHASAGDVCDLDQAIHSRIDLRGRKLAPVRSSD